LFYKKEKYVKGAGHMLARGVKIISKLLILDNVSFGSAWELRERETKGRGWEAGELGGGGVSTFLYSDSLRCHDAFYNLFIKSFIVIS
jgi:hypothetical protein